MQEGFRFSLATRHDVAWSKAKVAVSSGRVGALLPFVGGSHDFGALMRLKDEVLSEGMWR